MNKKVIISLIVAILIVILGVGIYFIINDTNKINEGDKEMPILNIKIGNEKYYYFNQSLPTNSKRVGNIKNGDLMLYGSDCFVLFYESFRTSYNYTRIGKIDNPSGLANAVGSGNVEVMFSID